MYYAGLLLGSVIYMLMQLNEVFHLKIFRWRIFIRTNIIAFISNITVGIFFIIGRDELISVYPITFISSGILGVAGQHLFKKITTAFDKSKTTVLGINE